MRTWRFAAGAAAMIMTHAAPAWAEAVVPTGLSGIADAGGVLGVTAQPGTQLAHNFRLRVAMAASSPIDPASDRLPRPHRIGSMIDYYPAGVSGLHFSAGVRALSNRIRGASNAFLSPADSALYTPKAGGPLVNHSGLRKASPAATLGWTTAFSPTAVLGFEAGTMMQHGNARATRAGIADPQLAGGSWTRMEPVAQVAFAMKF